MSWWTKKELHPKIKSKFVVVFSDVFYLPNVKSINKPSVEIETKEYRLLNHTFNYPGNAKWKPVTLKFVDMNGMGSKTEFFDTSAFLWQILNNTGYAYPKLDNSAIRSPHYTNVDTKDGKALTTSGGHHISTQIAFRDDPRTPLKEHNTWRTITTPEKSSNIANSFGAGLEGKIDKLPASPSRQRIAIYQISPGEKPVITEAWYLVNPIVKSINWGDLSYDSEELVEYELQIVYDWAVLDRTVIGDVLEVDEKPYQQFMKTLKNNKDSIKQEMKDLEEITRLKESLAGMDSTDLDILGMDLASKEPTDINGDGVISDEEMALWKKTGTDKEGNATYKATEELKLLRKEVQKAEDLADIAEMAAHREEHPIEEKAPGSAADQLQAMTDRKERVEAISNPENGMINPGIVDGNYSREEGLPELISVQQARENLPVDTPLPESTSERYGEGESELEELIWERDYIEGHREDQRTESMNERLGSLYSQIGSIEEGNALIEDPDYYNQTNPEESNDEEE